MQKKKIIALIVAIVVIVASGIGFMVINNNSNNSEKGTNNSGTNTGSNTNINENENNNHNEEKEENNQNSDKKIAIIYFSATGTTKTVATYIKDATGGDLIEIVPKDKYTDADLNYNNDNCRANKEQNDSSSRPAISNNINANSYDVIYLGYPIWWGDAPRIIYTFLDNHNLNGKTVIPFCTSGGSGIGTSVSYFKKNYKNVNWLDGRKLSTSKSEVTNWVNGLNY